ncbi:MAG: hypothetical protein C4B57_03480 [Deltaproteobacteria bacterium]|nr:MAG: hypothetical protein C4B57_03480 [Deltaproteobacteria bacterium]
MYNKLFRPRKDQFIKKNRNPESKYPVNPWSTVEVAIRALPQKRFAFYRVSTAGRIALPLRSAMSEL